MSRTLKYFYYKLYKYVMYNGNGRDWYHRGPEATKDDIKKSQSNLVKNYK